MARWTHGRTMILMIGLLGGLALATPADPAKPLRQAARGPSPEEAQLKQLPPPAQQVGRPAKADLLTRCQQRPACRAKLEMAQKRQPPATPRPAATSPSPVELELKKLPPPVQPVTPRRFQRGARGLSPMDGLLAWLNPFRLPQAEAQTAVSMYLTPQNWVVSSPYSYLGLYGVIYDATYYHFHAGYSTPWSAVENKPFVRTLFTAPASGWYIIDVRATSAAAKLRHQYSGPIIETWDAASVPCTGGICDYATMEYLQQGAHYFYFYSPTTSYLFYSVSIESYP